MAAEVNCNIYKLFLAYYEKSLFLYSRHISITQELRGLIVIE